MDPSPTFEAQGFACAADVLTAEALSEIEPVSLPSGAVGGSRCLLSRPAFARLAQSLRRHDALRALLPTTHVAVQCTYFEKSRERNWLVSLHQDLSIPVAARVDAPELSGWSDKEGVTFVQPPSALLEQLIAVRVHLDPCAEVDGPLRLVPGSHRLGILSPEDARAT